MKKKKEYVLLTVVFITFIILSQLAFVSAIKGSIGNARMVLYPEVNGLTNTIIEKSILVKNVNDFAIDVRLEVDRNSTDFLELVDKELSLEPGEDYRAVFNIKVKKPGKYDGKINVFFSEAGEGNGPGVALSSNIIIIAKNPKDFPEEEPEEPITEEPIIDNEDPITGEIIGKNKERNPVGVLLTITSIILIIALVVLYFLSEKKRKKNKKGAESKPKKSSKINETKKK